MSSAIRHGRLASRPAGSDTDPFNRHPGRGSRLDPAPFIPERDCGNMRKEGDHVTVSTKEARSGETSGHVRIVLIVGIALAIIGLIVALAVWSEG